MKSRIFAVLVSVFSVVILAGSVPTSSSARKAGEWDGEWQTYWREGQA